MVFSVTFAELWINTGGKASCKSLLRNKKTLRLQRGVRKVSEVSKWTNLRWYAAAKRGTIWPTSQIQITTKYKLIQRGSRSIIVSVGVFYSPAELRCVDCGHVHLLRWSECEAFAFTGVLRFSKLRRRPIQIRVSLRRPHWGRKMVAKFGDALFLIGVRSFIELPDLPQRYSRYSY